MADSHTKEKPGILSGRVYAVLALLLVTLAAFLRLNHLGLSSFRGDTILFWTLAQRGVPLGDLLTKWFETSGAVGQMPLAALLMQAFLNLVGAQQPSPFLVRLPFALTGLLAVPAALWMGRAAYGRAAGLMLAGFAAVGTFAVYHSQEAYVYAATLLGYFLYAAAFYRAFACLRTGCTLKAAELAGLAAGILFSAYSQVTGVFIVASGALVLAFEAWRGWRVRPATRTLVIQLAAVHAVVLAPLLFVAWGYQPILKQILANVSAGKAVVSEAGESPLWATGRMLLQLGWGSTWPGAVILLVGLAGAAHLAWRKREPQMLAAWFLVAVQVLLFLITRSAAGASFEPRYLSGVLPFLGLLVIEGYRRGPWAKAVPQVGYLLAMLALAYFLPPSLAVGRLTGKPAPYREMVNWCDANLPVSAPVLVDRWFEPWNELAAHRGTNAQFVFIQPNEPLEQFLRGRWRGNAERFFERFPEAAYLEVAKTYWHVPGVGPWEMPRQYFAQRHVFTNEAGLLLRRWGLASRGDFYAANSNRVVVELFYNTREDVVERQQRAGTRLYVYPGAGWKHEQSGPMPMFSVKTQDFRNWRRMEETVFVELFNLTTQDLRAVFSVRGVAVGGGKTVQVSPSEKHTFEPGRMSEWRVGPMDLRPGLSVLRLDDPLYPLAGNALLVDTLEVREATTP